jgi:hypothetical protein
MDSFNSFNISFIPRDKNQKVDSLTVVASLFNQMIPKFKIHFSVKIIFKPSIPDNQYFLQVFENDEQVVDFLVDSNDSSKVLMIKLCMVISKYCVNLNPFSQEMIKQKYMI